MKKMTRNTRIALLATAVLAVWLTLGSLRQGEATIAEEAQAEDARFTVAVTQSVASAIVDTISAQGSTEPFRAIHVRAQTEGQIARISVDAGSVVTEGQEIARIQLDDRAVRLREAEALLLQKESEFTATEQLQARGHLSKVQGEKARAEREAAQAGVERVKLDIARTRIRAPFKGIIESRLVSLGDYVAKADTVVTLVDNDPLRAVVHLSEQQVQHLAIGQTASVTLKAINDTREATVTAIAPRSDEKTRTYRVELQLANPQGTPSGGTVDVAIPVGEIYAHRISPSLLALDSNEQFGVKLVDENDTVFFHPVDIVKAETDGLWIAGLPENSRIITRGAGFVIAGEQVNVASVEQANTVGMSVSDPSDTND